MSCSRSITSTSSNKPSGCLPSLSTDKAAAELDAVAFS